MYFIAVTGGIASGKSTVARHLEKLGAARIDSDQVAREVVEPGEQAYLKIIEAFGEEVLNEDRTLNRAKLGEIIFNDAEQRAVLNSIVHPAIRERTNLKLERFAGHDNAVVIYEIPLLVEAKDGYRFDRVVTVEAGEQAQLQRLVELRGMTPEQAQARLASQSTRQQREELADVIIDSSGTLSETLAQTEDFWYSLESNSSDPIH